MRELYPNGLTTIVIYGAGEVGHHFVSDRKTFDDDDVLAEYSCSWHAVSNIEEDVRSATAVQIDQYTVIQDVQAIFEALEGDEGRDRSIADRIAQNALRESAGIIESRSLGMKGTYLKVLNSRFKEELNKHQY